MNSKLSTIAALILAFTLPVDTRAASTDEASTAQSLRVFWGDTHVHSSMSLDANLFGLTGLQPAAAYRFARGEAITAANGATAQLERPLDFLVISDHAEYLGVMPALRAGNKALLAKPVAQQWSETLNSGDTTGFGRMMVEIGHSYENGKPLLSLPDGAPSPWHANNRAADAANVPGQFTTFIGFEWTAMPGGDNLHRVVLLRDGAAYANTVHPFSAFDGDDPQDLWSWLENYETNTGGSAMAIPHNSNLSGGRMFATTDRQGRAFDAEYAARRQRWEPLVEVTQIKGDSEAHPALSPGDPFADYGTWDQYNIAMSEPQTNAMQRYQYARPALKLGLEVERATGINPFSFGLIGSSDSHSAPGAVAEHNYWGKKAGDEPGPARSQAIWGVPEADMSNTLQLASGYAAVWARENTREALFDAMQRREVYATTGTRILAQFYGGWHFETPATASHINALQSNPDIVPMGGTLAATGNNPAAPSFMVRALKDPVGANLDRIQVIKGWLDKSGRSHEKIYDVTWAGTRKVAASGQLPPVGNTVNSATASYDNHIGAPELSALWQDPDFDPAAPAFYYMRVLEIPTPRWPLYDKVRFKVTLPPGTQTIHQERAYTSPIWYRP